MLMRLRVLVALSLMFAVIVALSSRRLHAQSAPSPDAPPVSTAPDTTSDSTDANPEGTSAAPLRVSVNLTSLYFTVHAKNNELVSNLTKNDCTVFEDKVPQKLKNFVAETDQPLTLGILLDTSYSQTNVLPMEQQTGAAFLKRVLRTKDEAFLISFDVDVNLLQDFTSSARELSRAMDKAEINTAGGNGSVGGPGSGQGTIPTMGQPKGTLLYDAVYLASGDRLRSETGRKTLILLTDGGDQGSKKKLTDAIEAAQKSNAIVYVLLIADRQFYGDYPFGYNGPSEMKKLAEATGGRMIDVGNNGKKMEAAFAQIEAELRTQYVASYTPSNNKLDGTYRKVEIECKGDGNKVLARKGYYAVADTE